MAEMPKSAGKSTRLTRQMAQKEAEKIFDYDKDIVVGEYIKRLNKPIEIKADGRIQKVEG